MTIIKDTDLFVVNRGTEAYNYTGEQLANDIAEALASRDLKVWVQSSVPFVLVPPDYASQKDLWYDTSLGAFFIAQYDSSGSYVTWVVVNPADHRELLSVDVDQSGVVFPQGTTNEQEFIHPTNGVKYYFKALKNQWVDKELPGLDTFVLKEGDTMTGVLQLPNLIVTGDDTVEAHIELNEGLLTADDSVAGEEQRLYWNGDTVAKHEDVVTLTNSVINIDQHIENITPYVYRGLLKNSLTEDPETYVMYASGTATDNIASADEVFLSGQGSLSSPDLDISSINIGMYVEIQLVENTDVLTGKVTSKQSVTGGVRLEIEPTRYSDRAVVADSVAHIRIFSVADSSAKAGVFYQQTAPAEPQDVLKEGQLWIDSKTNLQYVWNGEEWVEVGSACGSGGGGSDIPVGGIMPYAGNVDANNVIPRGWLLCDGSSFDVIRYPDLYSVLKSSNTPNLIGRYLGGYGGLGLTTIRGYYSDSTKKPSTNGNNKVNVNSGGDHHHVFSKYYLKSDVSANTSNTGGHSHQAYMCQGGSGKAHDNYRGFADTSNNNGWNRSYGDKTANGQEYIKTAGAHSHTVTVNNGTLSWNSSNNGPNKSIESGGEHYHSIENTQWDSYTRPNTYAINWIIKHD